jgi:molybdenum cofactor synthesis domain-containing protein
MKVSILSIGTELTTGQIINRNSAWIAAKLKQQGLDSTVHVTVPDETEVILKSLHYCAELTDVLFITGGLGPTSDDFTRDVIAEWTGKKLIFDETSWVYIQEILKNRGVGVKAIQKQQCYFPEGSTILKNNKGTANAFSLDHKIQTKNLKIFVLPGPPAEIEAIWNDHINDWLEKSTIYVDKTTTYSWDTLGLPESDVATLTESALTELKKDFPITIGYRVHLPYVEVKMTYPTSADFTAKLFKDKVDQVLASITVLKNFEKISDKFAALIKNQSFAFYDFSTNGSLHQSLSLNLKKQSDWMWKQSMNAMDSDFFSEEDNFIALFNSDEKHCQIMADLNGKKFSKTIELPHRFLSMPERKSMYFAEMAQIEFVKFFLDTKTKS